MPALNQRFIGCRFADRCDQAWIHCHQQLPGWHSHVIMVSHRLHGS
ncbi:MAG: hypothetical protein WBP02_15780 [Gammaproteobacteria bacterium]